MSRPISRKGEMRKDIDQVPITIFDTETTGLDPSSGDKIVEIAAVRVVGQEVLGRFHSFVNPRREISPGAFAVNKITADLVKDAPGIEDVLPGFLAFSEGSCLCSYNVPFDMGFLRKEISFCGAGSFDEYRFIDALIMARRVFPSLERHALWFVAGFLGIEQRQEHRADSDVDITWLVFQRLKAALKEKGITDLDSYVSLFGSGGKHAEDLFSGKIAKIQEAIDTGMRLNIKYISSADALVSRREVSPKEIRYDKKSVYMIGYCHLKNENRMFRIDSILEMEPTG